MATCSVLHYFDPSQRYESGFLIQWHSLVPPRLVFKPGAEAEHTHNGRMRAARISLEPKELRDARSAVMSGTEGLTHTHTDLPRKLSM